MDWIKKHMMMVGVLVVVLVGGVWYGMSGGGTAQEPLLTTETVGDGSPSENVADRDLVDDPAFKTLQDFGTNIIPEPVGRPNPFAPLGRNQPNPQIQQVGAR
jgi:hypothetical protein